MFKSIFNNRFVAGRYKVTNPENIIEYFDNIGFDLTDDDILLLNNEYEMNEMGYLFVDSNWVKTSVYNSIWTNNSKLIEEYFVKWYVERTYPYDDGMCKHVECLFTKYNTPMEINKHSYFRNLGRFRKYKRDRLGVK